MFGQGCLLPRTSLALELRSGRRRTLAKTPSNMLRVHVYMTFPTLRHHTMPGVLSRPDVQLDEIALSGGGDNDDGGVDRGAASFNGATAVRACLFPYLRLSTCSTNAYLLTSFHFSNVRSLVLPIT